MKLHSSWKMDKKTHMKQKHWKMIYDPSNAYQITEMAIRTGLILSQDLGVRQNMVGHLRGNFYFTNYRHVRFARD